MDILWLHHVGKSLFLGPSLGRRWLVHQPKGNDWEWPIEIVVAVAKWPKKWKDARSISSCHVLHESSITPILNRRHQASCSFAIIEIMVDGCADNYNYHHSSTVYLLVILKAVPFYPSATAARFAQRKDCKALSWASNLPFWILDKLDISSWESFVFSNQFSLNLSKVPGSYGRQQWERQRSCCWCFLLSINRWIQHVASANSLNPYSTCSTSLSTVLNHIQSLFISSKQNSSQPTPWSLNQRVLLCCWRFNLGRNHFRWSWK